MQEITKAAQAEEKKGLLALQKASQLQDRLAQLAVEKHHESKLLADAASQVTVTIFASPLFLLFLYMHHPTLL